MRDLPLKLCGILREDENLSRMKNMMKYEPHWIARKSKIEYFFADSRKMKGIVAKNKWINANFGYLFANDAQIREKRALSLKFILVFFFFAEDMTG
ncbi:MAG: hypothetical protein M0R33_15620 [Methylomonas sp.]|jgi:hypothetical protein|uniref:hypothetical protein n=1 Tax=Methylomonas sp. TaxID=418 RepID=UPI0025D0106B|nr:hypothetical protein [Methylomonas sp.]MCK9607872.1 hypothetical protein [Methylomonas sp.]